MNINCFLNFHKSLVNAVYEINYHKELFESIIQNSGLTRDQFFAQTDLSTIGKIWQNFLQQLPDNDSIQRVPFFDICEICDLCATLEI